MSSFPPSLLGKSLYLRRQVTTISREEVPQYKTQGAALFDSLKRDTIADQTAEGDKVVTRYTVSDIHQGEFFGVAPTGERITMLGVSIDCFEGGKIVEEWPEYDLLG